MTRRAPLLLLLTMALSGCGARTGGFAIYMLVDDRPATALVVSDLADLPLRDLPFLGTDDLAWYDGATHEMGLKPDAMARVRQLFSTPVGANGMAFVVCAGRERIYAGAFWTPLSSQCYDGVVILQPSATDRTSVSLSLGYPGTADFAGQDPRSDPRLLGALAEAGKLR